ncbi:MAG: TAXI family TRAP transporter solute-binding subunit [Candidatus Cloacimonetes bacterium]|nr:TAXI family TRAP transporter solute-binding subunit [Candidatus Cloacimonadota bacterium]
MKPLFIILVVLVMLSACSSPQTKFVTVGTGGVTGVYYPTGGAISRMVNQKTDVYKVKMAVESTGGSVFNINGVMNGNLDFGIAQSDLQYKAYNGMDKWADAGKQTDLRSVFALHPETITLVASGESEIKTIFDLAGKRVNLGSSGSGQLQNAIDVLEALGISGYNEVNIVPVENPGLIQDRQIDAFFYTIGHPNGNIKEATLGEIPVRVIPISGGKISAMLKEKPYYTPTVIPREFYPEVLNKKDVESIGVRATLITSVNESEDVVYAVTKEIFENLEEFRKLHPAFKVLTKENMLQGLTAPIHPGALKYYVETGLAEKIDQKLILE